MAASVASLEVEWVTATGPQNPKKHAEKTHHVYEHWGCRDSSEVRGTRLCAQVCFYVPSAPCLSTAWDCSRVAPDDAPDLQTPLRTLPPTESCQLCPQYSQGHRSLPDWSGVLPSQNPHPQTTLELGIP